MTVRILLIEDNAQNRYIDKPIDPDAFVLEVERYLCPVCEAMPA